MMLFWSEIQSLINLFKLVEWNSKRIVDKDVLGKTYVAHKLVYKINSFDVLLPIHLEEVIVEAYICCPSAMGEYYLDLCLSLPNRMPGVVVRSANEITSSNRDTRRFSIKYTVFVDMKYKSIRSVIVKMRLELKTNGLFFANRVLPDCINGVGQLIYTDASYEHHINKTICHYYRQLFFHHRLCVQ